MVTFDYDESNRITKRNGDMFLMSPNSGGGGYLHDSLYTDLVYTNNKVRLERKGTPLVANYIPENETIIELDAYNRMIRKMKYNESDYHGRYTTKYMNRQGSIKSLDKT